MTGAGVSGLRAFAARAADRGSGWQPSREMLEEMAAAQDHRGGGGTDVWLARGVGLARSRSHAADDPVPQPARSADGRWVVALDGTLRDQASLRAHLGHLRSRDDGELVAAGLAWEGISFIERLTGQFALVAHDLRTDTTHLVRDRIGVQPLHYRHVPGGIAFASEVKALLVLGPRPEVDHRSLDAYLAHRTVPAPDTLFEGVKKVRPAHRVSIMPGGHLEETAYWSPPDADPDGTWTADDAIEAVRDGVREAVRSSLAPDTPVGINLTGGLASSLLAAQAQQLRGDETVHTFSLAHGDDAADELARTGRLSALLGTLHHDVHLGRDDLDELWGPLTWHRDAPLSDPADLAAHVLDRTAAEHVPEILCAQGADELFGGHQRYRLAGVAERSYGLPVLPAPLRSGLGRRVERRLGATFSATERRRLLGHAPPRDRRASATVGVDPVDRMLRHDLRHTLPDDVLERLDRMSSATSLAVGLPLLDHRLVELAFRLPTSVKVRAGCTTWVLREAARPLLPDEVIERRVPEPGAGSWWYAGMRDTVRQRLTGPGSWIARTLDQSLVRDLLLRHEHGGHEQDRIWALVALEVWHESFFAETPSVPRPRGAVPGAVAGSVRLSS
jgi:asparagine synthase (glutamine-hydrolysing)